MPPRGCISFSKAHKFLSASLASFNSFLNFFSILSVKIPIKRDLNVTYLSVDKGVCIMSATWVKISVSTALMTLQYFVVSLEILLRANSTLICANHVLVLPFQNGSGLIVTQFTAHITSADVFCVLLSSCMFVLEVTNYEEYAYKMKE